MALENTHFGAEKIAQTLENCRSIFFIGIGGISMSSLAQISLQEGYRVGGSDRSPGTLTDRLQKQGAEIFTSHHASNIRGYDAVVYTVAIAEDNPEYCAASLIGLPIYSRSDYLGYLMMRFRTRVGIAGMHGKSTCTAMCSRIFMEAGDPTVFCGAELPQLNGETCHIGESREHFVFEACEYMDSFLDFNPTLAVILNIGMDHVDYFHGMAQIRESFLRYAERTGQGGIALYNADDAECVCAMEHFSGKHITFGLQSNADFTACNLTNDQGVSSFDFCWGSKSLCHITLHACGMHNVYNALAAASAAALCGIAPAAIARGLSDFIGAKRRMEYKGDLNGAAIFDDYGHHPDEIQATLAGARELPYSRVLCAYQPHTYSRTAGLLDSFSNAFGNADLVFLADIYAAREQNVYGVTSQMLTQRIGEKAQYCSSFAALAEAIRKEAREGDLVFVMGAGDVYRVFDLLQLE